MWFNRVTKLSQHWYEGFREALDIIVKMSKISFLTKSVSQNITCYQAIFLKARRKKITSPASKYREGGYDHRLHRTQKHKAIRSQTTECSQARIQGRWNGWIFTPPPLFLSPLLSFLFLIPQILIGSNTLLQKFTPHFKILDPRLVVFHQLKRISCSLNFPQGPFWYQPTA